ncbi:ABC transporter permease, partial [Streptomyces sp. NPDC005047]
MTQAETDAAAGTDESPSARPHRPSRWRMLGRDRAAAVGAVVLTLVALVALFGRLFIGDRAQRQDLDASLRPPSLSDGVYGLLGT